MRKISLTKIQQIEEIIKEAQVCYLALVDKGMPYLVPMNFGYSDGCFYIHSGKTGHKMEIIRENPEACIALDTGSELHVVSETMACSYSMKYKSVVAKGHLVFLETDEEKIEGMNIIMKHYTDKAFSYNKPAIDNVEVMVLKVREITGINRGYC